MKKELSLELKEFVESFCREMKVKNIDLENMDLKTSLDLDLNIFDLDVDVFINDFIKKFDIDISSFEWGKQLEYPSDKDMSTLYSIFRSFNYRKNWVRKICRKLYKPKLFLIDFQNALENKTFL